MSTKFQFSSTRSIVLSILSLLVFSSSGQEHSQKDSVGIEENQCFCFEHEFAGKVFSERLYFLNDSVFIRGALDVSCKEKFDPEVVIESCRNAEQAFPFRTENDSIHFEKKIMSSSMDISFSILYKYECKIEKNGISTLITYEPKSFKDSMGPPNRFYRVQRK